MKTALKLLNSKFDIKDLGEVKKFLGLKSGYKDEHWNLHQKNYIDKLKQEFNFIPFLKCSLPLFPGIVVKSLRNEQFVKGEFSYRNLIDLLLFLATGSRPKYYLQLICYHSFILNPHIYTLEIIMSGFKLCYFN